MAIDKSTSPLARQSQDAELWRLLGQRSRDATLKRKAKNEPSPREASQSCQLTRASRLILPAHRRSSRGCTPSLHPHCSSAQPILAPSAAVLGAGSARSRRERAGHGTRARCRLRGQVRAGRAAIRRAEPQQFSSTGSSEQRTDPLLRLGGFGRSSLFEQQMVLRLFPATAELTSHCTLSPWSIIVSSVITNSSLVLHCASAVWLSAQHSNTLAQHLWLFGYARTNTLQLHYCR